jgi:hypothetical protein
MKSMSLRAFVAVFCLMMSIVAQAKVWEATETWDERWEEQYSNWIRTQFNEDVFVRGPYAGLATDCADAVYAARIIFSFQNKLPFVTVDEGGDTLSNINRRFDHLPEGTARVRAFIEMIAEERSTENLPRDTYPVAINRDVLKPGVIWLRSSRANENFFVRLVSGRNPPSGHTEVVKDVSSSGVVYLMGSTVPAKVRTLLISTSLVYAPGDSDLGFRRWVWPQNIGKSKSSMNGYSLEQYDFGRTGSNSRGKVNVQDFSREVQSRLATRAETAEELLQRMAQDLCAQAHLRNEVVQDALNYRAQIGGCLSGEDYESFSTPSRDKRMKQSLDQMIEITTPNRLLVPAEKKIARIVPYFGSCRALTLRSGVQISMQQVLTALAKKNLSSNPNESEAARWGLEGESHSCR